MTLVRLIFCPDADGSAGQLQPIPFSPDVEVMAVQYHGHDLDISRLAKEVVALGEKPTVFFGHDRGALVAFETVRRLEETTTGPYALILLTTYPCPPGSRVRSPITVITGDPQTTVDEEWRKHTEGAFQLKVFDDGEFSVTDYVNVVNDEIDRMIRWLNTSRRYLTMF